MKLKGLRFALIVSCLAAGLAMNATQNIGTDAQNAEFDSSVTVSDTVDVTFVAPDYTILDDPRPNFTACLQCHSHEGVKIEMMIWGYGVDEPFLVGPGGGTIIHPDPDNNRWIQYTRGPRGIVMPEPIIDP